MFLTLSASWRRATGRSGHSTQAPGLDADTHVSVDGRVARLGVTAGEICANARRPSTVGYSARHKAAELASSQYLSGEGDGGYLAGVIGAVTRSASARGVTVPSTVAGHGESIRPYADTALRHYGAYLHETREQRLTDHAAVALLLAVDAVKRLDTGDPSGDVAATLF